MSVLTKSYSIVRSNQMTLDSRLLYIKKITRANPTICPECEHTVEPDVKDEIICSHCGLVCSGPIDYVGLVKVDYPFRH